jgi:hypothetical protein
VRKTEAGALPFDVSVGSSRSCGVTRRRAGGSNTFWLRCGAPDSPRDTSASESLHTAAIPCVARGLAVSGLQHASRDRDGWSPRSAADDFDDCLLNGALIREGSGKMCCDTACSLPALSLSNGIEKVHLVMGGRPAVARMHSEGHGHFSPEVV